MTLQRLTVVFLILTACSGNRAADPFGTWVNRDSTLYMSVGPEKTIMWQPTGSFGAGSFTVYQNHIAADTIRLRQVGDSALLIYSPGLDSLAFTRAIGAGGVGLGRHSDSVPELHVEPMDLPDPVPVADSQLERVRENLIRRAERDQRVRRDFDPSDTADIRQMQQVDSHNSDWLVLTIRRVGWIDRERFGEEAAAAAFLIAQHSGDLRLQRAALAAVEPEVLAGEGNAQEYALLYDRIRWNLAEKQLYGTQAIADHEGTWIITCVENPDGLDERRAQLGLPSMEVYREAFVEVYGTAFEIRPEACPL